MLLLLSTVVFAWLRADRDRLVRVATGIAITGPLTGLLNRRGLEEEADIVHSNATRTGCTTVVAMLDLEGLKEFNDTHGHEAGDAFIAAGAAHRRAALRQGDPSPASVATSSSSSYRGPGMPPPENCSPASAPAAPVLGRTAGPFGLLTSLSALLFVVRTG